MASFLCRVYVFVYRYFPEAMNKPSSVPHRCIASVGTITEDHHKLFGWTTGCQIASEQTLKWSRGLLVVFAFKIKVSIIFQNNTRKLTFKEVKLTGLWARNCAIITVILKFAFGPENFPGLSRNGPHGEKENRRAKRAESGLRKKKGGVCRLCFDAAHPWYQILVSWSDCSDWSLWQVSDEYPRKKNMKNQIHVRWTLQIVQY